MRNRRYTACSQRTVSEFFRHRAPTLAPRRVPVQVSGRWIGTRRVLPQDLARLRVETPLRWANAGVTVAPANTSEGVRSSPDEIRRGKRCFSDEDYG